MNGDQMMYANVNPLGMEMPVLGMPEPMLEMAMPEMIMQAMQMPTMPVMPMMPMPCMQCMAMPHPQPHHPPMGVSPLYEISSEQKAALRELMEIDFALIELNLYLDTHPTDADALAQYNRYAAMRPVVLRRVEALYGPISPTSPMSHPWSWINEPWPWKIRF